VKKQVRHESEEPFKRRRDRKKMLYFTCRAFDMRALYSVGSNMSFSILGRITHFPSS
jgi:hypothetical protein